MAFGRFADLSRYIQAANQPTQDPLSALAQGFQQGNALANLPQTLQDQRDMQVLNQLQKQLTVQTMQQKLYDLQNPNAALSRRVAEELTLKGALNPELGITQAPADLIGVPIGVPSVISPSQEAEIAAGVTPTLSNVAPAFENPISILGSQTGLNRNLNIPLAAQARKESDALNKFIQEQAIRSQFKGGTREVSPGQTVIERQPDGTYKEMFKSEAKPASLGAPQFVRSLTDPKDTRLVNVDASGQAPQGYEFLKTAEGQMKPSERITAQKEIRQVYDELPAKLDLFGKGQVTGSDQLKTRLDAVLNPVKGDFSKLNPQAKQTFVFALNKLRDPTSATLLAEAKQIADKSGIGDRFGAFINSYTEGDPLPDQVAKDIYDVISQVQAVHKENLINSLIPIKDDADLLGKKLTSFGVPKAIQEEVERRIANPAAPTQDQAIPRPLSTGLIIRKVSP